MSSLLNPFTVQRHTQMDVLNQNWWGSGVLSAAQNGDFDHLNEVLTRYELGKDPCIRCPGDNVVLEGEDEEQVRRRRRKVAINYRNEDGLCAVHMATSASQVSMIEYLAQEGADLDATTAYGRSPLHISLEECNSEVIVTLLVCGASTATLNHNKLTPLQVAERDLQTSCEFSINLRRAAKEETESFEQSLAALQKELGILQSGGGEGGQLGFMMHSTNDPDAKSLKEEEERTREQVAIEMEDLEADHNELIQPLSDKIAALDVRQGRLRKAVDVLTSQGVCSEEVDEKGCLQTQDKEDEDCSLDPEAMRLFEQHSRNHMISIEKLEHIYKEQVADDFGLVKTDPLKDFNKALRWLGLSPRQRNVSVGLNEYSFIMLQLEQR